MQYGAKYYLMQIITDEKKYAMQSARYYFMDFIHLEEESMKLSPNKRGL